MLVDISRRTARITENNENDRTKKLSVKTPAKPHLFDVCWL